VNAVLRGPGCGRSLPTNQVSTVAGSPTGYTKFIVMTTGATLAGPVPAKAGPRTFWVRVPADYDSTLPLYSEAQGGTEEAIYVIVDLPTVGVDEPCYDTASGPMSQEWEAFQLFQTFVDEHYCVDDNRIFVTGFSAGGWLANMWGCYFAGDGQRPASDPATPRAFAPTYHVRGQAVNSGGEPANDPPCNGPVAAIWIHGTAEALNPFAGDQAALARVLKMNGCEGSPTAPWHPEVSGLDVCQQYTACPADYPVVFCATNLVSQNGPDVRRAVPAFKLLFDALDPPH
jgi:hypothetical protein